MHRRLLPCALCLGLLITVVGCGPDGPATYDVTGHVTFDGQPVEEGEIIFRAADGSQGSWEEKIKGGKYSFRCTPGKKRVEITARKKVEAPVADSGEPAISFQMYIPEKYNERSELTADVTPEGPNQFDFSLKPE